MHRIILTGALLGAMSAAPALAHDNAVTSQPSDAILASVDIIETSIVTRGDNAVFTTRLRLDGSVDVLRMWCGA